MQFNRGDNADGVVEDCKLNCFVTDILSNDVLAASEGRTPLTDRPMIVNVPLSSVATDEELAHGRRVTMRGWLDAFESNEKTEEILFAADLNQDIACDWYISFVSLLFLSYH